MNKTYTLCRGKWGLNGGGHSELLVRENTPVAHRDPEMNDISPFGPKMGNQKGEATRSKTKMSRSGQVEVKVKDPTNWHQQKRFIVPV